MQITEIKDALNDLLEEIALHANKQDIDTLRLWLMAAVFRIWSANELFSEDYLSVLSVFSDQEYTKAQVITALDCAGEADRELTIPDFFREIVEKDKMENTAVCRKITESIGRFLALTAMYNGDFTMGEARRLHSICDQLLNFCSLQGIAGEKTLGNYPEMVTPLNKNGYYQNTAKNIPAGDENNTYTPKQNHRSSEASLPTDEQKNLDVNMTLTLNIIPDQSLESEHITDTDIQQTGKSQIAAQEESLESLLAELESLVGLSEVKRDVHSLLNFIKICQLRQQRGMKVPTVSYHLVFTGNPGTGKTTVARIVAKIYYMMGILPQGQLIETDRSGLVAGYLGQTAIKTQKVIQEALGGVLFIDEAYALANDERDSYGKEAIETILKAMEDHRDKLVVIVAGYDELMHKFIDSNPGLRSRFNKYFHFPDYTGEEMLLILKRFCDANGYVLAEDALSVLQTKFNILYNSREEHFGNARMVRNLFEQTINQQANRLVMDREITNQELAELTLQDILPVLERM